MSKKLSRAQLEEELELAEQAAEILAAEQQYTQGKLDAALKTIAEHEKAFERIENGFCDLQCDLFSGPYYKAYRR